MKPHSADEETETVRLSNLLASVWPELKPKFSSMLVNQLPEKRKKGGSGGR